MLGVHRGAQSAVGVPSSELQGLQYYLDVFTLSAPSPETPNLHAHATWTFSPCRRPPRNPPFYTLLMLPGPLHFASAPPQTPRFCAPRPPLPRASISHACLPRCTCSIKNQRTAAIRGPRALWPQHVLEQTWSGKVRMSIKNCQLSRL